MSDTIPAIPTQTPVTSPGELPTAAIVCIAVGGYVVLVVIILVLRQCCLARGQCGQWEVCGKEEQPQCCECCISLSESCDCCKSPSVSTCLDSICPNRKQYTCVDLILCQCCAGSGSSDTCNDIQCGSCQCSCGCNTDCEYLNCCCFQLQMESTSPRPTPRSLSNSTRLDKSGSFRHTGRSLTSPRHCGHSSWQPRPNSPPEESPRSPRQLPARPQPQQQQNGRPAKRQLFNNIQQANGQPSVHRPYKHSLTRVDISQEHRTSTRRPVPPPPISAFS